VTEFGSTTAREFDLVAACDAVLEFIDEINNWPFGLGDLLGEPIVKTADSLYACFYLIGGGGAVTVGPLVTKWGSSTDIDERIVSRSGVGMAIYYRNVFEFRCGG
jgi:hypothetical protein